MAVSMRPITAGQFNAIQAEWDQLVADGNAPRGMSYDDFVFDRLRGDHHE